MQSHMAANKSMASKAEQQDATPTGKQATCAAGLMFL